MVNWNPRQRRRHLTSNVRLGVVEVKAVMLVVRGVRNITHGGDGDVKVRGIGGVGVAGRLPREP